MVVTYSPTYDCCRIRIEFKVLSWVWNIPRPLLPRPCQVTVTAMELQLDHVEPNPNSVGVSNAA